MLKKRDETHIRIKQRDHEEYVKIGLRIRSARIKAGMSQEETADFLGLTFQQVQKYEKGANRIPISTAIKLAKRFSVTPSWLFGYEEETEDEAKETRLSTIRGGATLLGMLTQLNDQQIAAISLVAATFVKENNDGA